MANILLGIEHGVEVAAEDLLKFVSGAKLQAAQFNPEWLPALGYYLAP